MAFPRFSFSTTYEDTNQFPTGPRGWRTFLQQLHNETKTFLTDTLGPWMDSLERLKVKSGCYAKANANQGPFTAGQFTKANFAVEVKDYNTEYDPTTSIFTAKTAGLYHVEAALGWPAATGRIFTEVWINGVAHKRISEQTGQMANIGGCDVDLAANDAVTINVYPVNAVTTDGSTNPVANYFTVTKIG